MLTRTVVGGIVVADSQRPTQVGNCFLKTESYSEGALVTSGDKVIRCVNSGWVGYSDAVVRRSKIKGGPIRRTPRVERWVVLGYVKRHVHTT
jgi:hypothetical protein